MRKLPLLIIACAVTSGITFVTGATLAADEAPVAANAQPDATVSLNAGSAAAGIGYVWGHGDLTYKDQTYHISISGVSVADVGAAKITAEGSVYHLNNLADFDGTYTTVSAGLTGAGGGSATYMKNQHGVVIKLTSKEMGVRIHLSAEGVKIKIQK